MLECGRLSDPEILRSADAILFGTCCSRRQNLVSTDQSCKVSLGFLLKRTLSSSISGIASPVHNVLFLNQPYNYEETALVIMRTLANCSAALYPEKDEKKAMFPIIA